MNITYGFTPNNFKVSDFLSWQRAGTLDLSPKFQRRSVWKPGAKSYLIDSVERGLPVPLLFLRERVDLTSGETIREVVDGQQRLRTLFGYIDSSSLKDYSAERDAFVVSRLHNDTLGGKVFPELSEESRARILGYRLSVQTLPDEMSDADILEVFARLNSTGQRLTAQELRNAAYFGACKSLLYRLTYKHTDQWLKWGVFNAEQMSRMTEVEMASDLVNNMMTGLSGKSKVRLDRMYKNLDEEFPGAAVVAKRFSEVMDAIDSHFGELVKRSVYSREVHFFTLFVYTYNVMYGLGSKLSAAKPRKLPRNYRTGLVEASRRFKELEVPPLVLDSVTRASADFGRRRTRLNYLQEVIDGSV